MADPPATTFLVRYGEIGLKSLPVRRRFEHLLGVNILRGLKVRGAVGKIQHVWGRLFVQADDAVGREVLARTFGIVSFSPVVEAPGRMEALAAFVGEAAGAIPPGASFAIRARRTGDTGFTSQDLARAAGASVLALHRARGLRVNLDAPDVEIVVEVRDDRAWVAFESLPGPGGLPVSSEGRVAAWLASPRDAGAAWLLLKRGCRVDALAPRGRGEALAKKLSAWDAALELTEVDVEDADRAHVLALLEQHARRRNGSGVVLGDDFAAALALAPLDRRIAMPVFRPLLALEPAAVADVADRLGLDLALAPARPRGASLPVAPAAPVAPLGLEVPAEASRARALELLRGAHRRKVGL